MHEVCLLRVVRHKHANYCRVVILTMYSWATPLMTPHHHSQHNESKNLRWDMFVLGAWRPLQLKPLDVTKGTTPHECDASGYLSRKVWRARMDIPFQVSINVSHQYRSVLNSLFSWIWWFLWLVYLRRAIIPCIIDYPGAITLAAWWTRLTNDSNFCIQHYCLFLHWVRIVCTLKKLFL